jgi:hypothetical protein
MSHLSITSDKVPQIGTDWAFWRQWVAANAIAELVGLGGAALIGVLVFARFEAALTPLLAALIMIVGGTFLEGVMVGVAQWLVLRQAISRMPWKSWIAATAVGAFVAWTLGMIPSTIMSMAETESAAASPEISEWIIFSLAALMGLVLGPILALPQWWVLRRYVERASWWIPANALAWMVGMVLVFVGVGLTPESISLVSALFLLITFALAGATVGAIHGLFLIRLLKQEE